LAAIEGARTNESQLDASANNRFWFNDNQDIAPCYGDTQLTAASIYKPMPGRRAEQCSDGKKIGATDPNTGIRRIRLRVPALAHQPGHCPIW
jgi:hypothetical protein